MTGDRSNSDEIARIAVRALLDGRADSVDGAIDFAMNCAMNCATDFARNSARDFRGNSVRAIAADGTTAHRLNNRGVARPSRALLRAHAQAMEESQAGDLARKLRIEATMHEALGVLSILEESLITHDRDAADHAPPAVYGRAVRGEFDLDPSVHIRVITTIGAHVLAQSICDAKLGEAEVKAIDTRYGHLDEITFDGEYARYSIARIPPRARIDADADLYRGNPVEHADFEALLRRMPRFGSR